MEHTYWARYGDIIIRPLKCQDIELLRKWRNDYELSKYLRPIDYITSEMQRAWFIDYLKSSNTYFFAICNEVTDKVIGSVAIYNVNDKNAEIGKLVIGDASARGRHIGYSSIVMAMQIGYEFIGIENYSLDCHENNIAALKNYLRAGYKEVRKHTFINGGCELEMRIDKTEFVKNNEILSEINTGKTNICSGGGE